MLAHPDAACGTRELVQRSDACHRLPSEEHDGVGVLRHGARLVDGVSTKASLADMVAAGNPQCVACKAVAALHRYQGGLPGGGRVQVSCQSPVWDTAWALLAAERAGMRLSAVPYCGSIDWLVDRQTLAEGDWSARAPLGLGGGGWSFQYENRDYPDVDDTALVLTVLAGALTYSHEAPWEGRAKAAAALRIGARSQLAMQNEDGGWSAQQDPRNRATPFNGLLLYTLPPPGGVMRRAVVIGASVAGMSAAKVLAGHFDHVEVIERDPAPGAGVSDRKGLPQGRHVHVLLKGGEQALESVFPGFVKDLEAGGSKVIDMTQDAAWFHHGVWKLRHPGGPVMHLQSRPLIDACLRRRLLQLPNVTVHYGRAVSSLEWDARSRRVRGIHHRSASEPSSPNELIEAALVVDASGRGSHLPRWMKDWGFQPPAESRIGVDVQYSSRLYEAPPAGTFPWKMLIISPSAPLEMRAGGIMPIEDGRWLVSLAGCAGDHPPQRNEGFMAFAASLPQPDIHAALLGRTPVSDVISYRVPYTRVYHYERCRQLPVGVVALGDAVCGLDPAFGQGMTTAARGTVALDQWLTRNAPERYFYRALARSNRDPLLVTNAENLRYHQIPGHRPFGLKLFQAYVKMVLQACATDPVVYQKVAQVQHLLVAPQRLFAPPILWRALKHRWRSEAVGPSALPVSSSELSA